MLYTKGRFVMSKKLCSWDKDDYDKKMDKYQKLVDKPVAVCKKCGRAVNDEKNVCKPAKIK